MSKLREQLGQLLIMGFEGSDCFKSEVSQWIIEDGIGGVLLFNRDLNADGAPKNIVDVEQVKALTKNLYDLALAHQNQPLLIAVDYEGGAVDRFSGLNVPFHAPSPEAFSALSAPMQEQVAMQMANTVRSLGFNVDFAPSVDLAIHTDTGIIGRLGRSYGREAHTVSASARRMIEAFKKEHLITCLKHFPGHGSACGDTHEGFVDVTPWFNPQELAPYRDLAPELSEGMMIMTAHVVNRHLDPSGVPATLSYPILTQLLREEMGYAGVIVSDDLQMKAISTHFTMEKALKETFNAGADMVIIGNQLGFHRPQTVIDALELLVNQGEIPYERVAQACERVKRLKGFLI